jgi:hypothetical protein
MMKKEFQAFGIAVTLAILFVLAGCEQLPDLGKWTGSEEEEELGTLLTPPPAAPVAPVPLPDGGLIVNGGVGEGDDGTFTPSTALTLMFAGDISWLTPEHIDIKLDDSEEGVSIEKGKLISKGNGVYELQLIALLDTGPNREVTAAVAILEKDQVSQAGSEEQNLLAARFSGDRAGADTSDTDKASANTIKLYGLIAVPDAEILAGIGGGDEYPFNGSYRQTADITITGTWTPVGTGDPTQKVIENCFTGVFDGGGYKIIPDNITSTGDLSIFGSAYNAKFEDVHIGEGSMTTTGASAPLGGIARTVKNTTFTHCSNAADLTGTSGVGGICYGLNSGSSIIDCWNTGNISAIKDGSRHVGGGISAIVSSDATVQNCWNSGEVTGSEAGGIAGGSGGKIIACYNTGAVAGTNGEEYIHVGGIVGNSGGTSNTGVMGEIIACYNTGAVSVNGVSSDDLWDIDIGGVTGCNTSGYVNIYASYSIGTVSYSGNCPYTAVGVGAFSGLNMFYSSHEIKSPTITDCYWNTTVEYGIGWKAETDNYFEGSPTPSNEGAARFSGSAWPSAGDSGWGIGNDSENGKYWKDLGSWSSESPVYPKLWFED